MSELTLVARFPSGKYDAHDAHGQPEWPPHPLRLGAALLSAAHGAGEHIQLARRAFSWSSPTLWTPQAAARHTDVSRWVPVDPALNLSTPRGNPAGAKGIDSRIPKPPERGTTLGSPAEVWFHFAETDLGEDDLNALDGLLRFVTYLGRPTSPVVLDRVEQFLPPRGDGFRWRPDDDGDVLLRTCTPAALVRFDLVHEQRMALPDPGYRPNLPRGQGARYSVTADGSEELAFHLGSSQAADAIAQGMSWLATPNASAEEASLITSLLPEGSSALPCFWTEADRGRAVRRMSGVLVHPALAEPLTAIVSGAVATLRPRLVPPRGAPRERLREMVSAAQAWTTSAPVPHDRERILHELREIASVQSARLVDAAVHDPGRVSGAPDTVGNEALTHLSVVFNRPVSGPLPLLGTALVPIRA